MKNKKQQSLKKINSVGDYSKDIKLVRWMNIVIIIISSLVVIFALAFGFSLSVVNESIQENGGYENLERMLDQSLSDSVKEAQTRDNSNSGEDVVATNSFIGASYSGMLSQVFASFAALTVIVILMNCVCIILSSIILAKHKNKDLINLCFKLSIAEIIATILGLSLINLVLAIISVVRLSFINKKVKN